jgi:hypothetical protein
MLTIWFRMALELEDMEAGDLAVTVARRTRATRPEGRVHGVSQQGLLLSCQALHPEAENLALSKPLFYAQ